MGWLAFVPVPFSGGAWTGDSYEHSGSAPTIFLRQWPPGRLFIDDLRPFPARPPLANVLTAAFMHITREDYAHYQVISAILCSLAYLPVGLLPARFGGRHGGLEGRRGRPRSW